MPRPSRAAATKATEQISKKRKLEEEEDEVDEVPQPAKHKLKKSDINGSAEHNVTESPKGKRAKQKIIVDEPARTDIAEQQRNSRSDKKSKKTAQKGKTEAVVESQGKTGIPQTLVSDTELRAAPSDDDESDTDTKKAKTQDKKAKTEDKQPKAKRKTKEEKEAEMQPLAARTSNIAYRVGAHVSISGGVENAVSNTLRIGGNAFALFLQSQRKWENPPLKDENKDAFISACELHKIDAQQHVVPHGSYLVNLAAKDEDQANKSYKFFLNDLQRCEALGIKYYNFHPGGIGQTQTLQEGISRLAKRLNQALSETTTVVPLLENMAGTESIIGSRFTDLSETIAQIKPEYQSRIGICIDTCHTFAAGYDLRSPDAYAKTMQQLDDTVGLKYAKALHMNDSKGVFNSKKDLHQNIGLGFLGLRAFHNIMNDPRLTNIPMILETPAERPDPKDPKKTIEDKSVYAKEIKLLESLVGMDAESDEFKKLETDLAARGQAERDKMEKWQAEKEQKEREKLDKARKKMEMAEKGQGKLSFGSDGQVKKGKTKTKTKSKESASASASGSGSDAESD